MFSLLKQDKSMYRRLLTLGLPIMLQNLITSCVGFADTIMVGLVGQNQLAGVSLSNNIFFVEQLFVFGIMSGGSVLMSQYWGKRDTDSINRIFGIGTMAAGVFTLIFATLVFLMPTQIMSIVSYDDNLVSVAAEYGRIVAYSYFLNALTMVYVAAQRSMENPRFGMTVLGISCGLNLLLNWVLIFGKLGFEPMGVIGAAWATLISRCVELAFTVVYMTLIDKRMHFNLKLALRPGITLVKDFIKYATPVVANEALWGLGTSIYPIIYGHMANASDIVAAYAVSGNVEKLVTVVTFAIANATAVMVGNEIGRGRSHEQVQRVGGWLLLISVMAGVLSGGIIIGVNALWSRSVIMPLFSLNENAVRIAMTMLYLIGGFMVTRNFNSTLIVGVLRGGGDVRCGMYIDVGAMYLYTVPVAALTGLVLKWDIAIVYTLILLEEAVKTVFGFVRYRSGKWIRSVARDIPTGTSPSIEAGDAQ